MDKEDVVLVYNGILLSHEKKNETMPVAATWMDLECVILGEISQMEGGEITYVIPYMDNLKINDTNELLNKTERDRLREQTYGCQGKRMGGRDI